MTVKTQNAKVILKNGKVSCSCCGKCCMYPAQALADGLYTADDLPDALTHISRNGTIRNISRSGTDYLVAEGPLGKIGAEFDATGSSIPLWLFYDDAGSQAGSRCLFQKFAGSPPGYPVEDQFADTYTVAYVIGDDNIGSTTITRQSLCVWTGNAGGVLIRLEYESADFFRWFMITPETEIAKAEPSFENTPTGFYQTGNIEFTVS